MTRKTVVLTPQERAICRVRYRHVATYMDPGPQPMTPNDRICQAIAAHWKNGEALEHGSEYSDSLFPFGNKRAVSRHINKGSPKTADADRVVAFAWVETQPKDLRVEILALLGLADPDVAGEDEEEVDSKVKVKDEPLEVHVKKETVDVGRSIAASGKRKLEEVVKTEEDTKVGGSMAPSGKRKLEEVVKTEEDTKVGVLSKRPRASTTSVVKTETEDAPLKAED
ncbi:hypothetical protein K438DRAFT_1942611 [Mycena galopus ATCC 62051]|nr:hypothetical protein K438DRAFT_1942611 [Mycena galopus ATCC 62051]